MDKSVLKNKKVWLTAVALAFGVTAFLFHLNLKRKSLALSTLKNSSNLTLTLIPPKWASKLPDSVVQYLEPSFPIEADFSLEESISIIEDHSKKDNKTISLNKASSLLNELGNVEIFKVDCSRHPEIGSTEEIDSVLAISSLLKLHIIGNRLIIKEEHDLSNLRELNIECSDVSNSLFTMLSHNSKMQKLLIRSKAYMSGDEIQNFKNMSKLQHLDLDSIKCRESDLSFLTNLKNLETVNLSSYKDQIIDSWGEGGIKLPGGFQLDESLQYFTNLKKLKKISAIIVLTKENLESLNSASLFPTAYYRFPNEIDDNYLKKLGFFLDNFSIEQESVVKGMMQNLNLKGQKGVTDASIPFLAKFKPPVLDLRGTSITKLKDLPLDSCTSFRLPENSNIADALPAMTAKDYDLIDIRGSEIDDFILAKIFKQTRPKIFYMDGHKLTSRSIDNAMDYFNEKPKEISKISFGSWDIPQKRRLEFLDRVHQWGMSVVYSSHLTPDLILQNWHLHKTKTVVHDRVGNLKDLHKIFPSVKTLVLKGLPLAEEEWKDFHNLKSFDSLYLESPQNGLALTSSGILKKIENFDIKNSMNSPVQLTSNIRKCRVFLKNSEPFKNIIDFSKGSPENLVIDGKGSLDLSALKGAENLKFLTIGPDILVHGKIPKLSGLQSFRCLSTLNSESLESMQNLKGIKVLLLNCENLTQETFSKWKTLNHLQVLDLSAAPLNNNQLKELNNFPALRVLNLPAHKGITPDLLPQLEGNPELFKLNIIGTSIFPEHLGDKYSLPGHWDYEI